MKKTLIIIFTLFIGFYSFSHEKPKLVVGIVVDQMRYDYIYRFWSDFGDDGFKKLINEGHFFRNCQFGYVPTYTGPGHASIFTGTTPAVHGIIANDWYDKSSGKYIYCVGDNKMNIIGFSKKNIEISEDGKMSPHKMLTTTFGDELKIFNDESKVIGISLKDRGAILPAGHTANAAYWLSNNGKWITSSFYMESLPNYVQEINDRNDVQKYLKGDWKINGKFTHNLENLLEKSGGGAIKKTPFGNSILKDLAIEILEEEKLGQDNNTDILTLSFSSTDYIGHQFGPHSYEIKDTYLRLDKDISMLLKYIDSMIGFQNTIIFITADHGVVSEPHQLMNRKIPAGYYDKNIMISELKEHLNKKYNSNSNAGVSNQFILNFSNNNLYLNHQFILDDLNISIGEIQNECAKFLLKYKWVKNTYTASQLHENEYSNSFHSLIQRGFNQKKSGDVIVSLQSGWLSVNWRNGGTTHGSCYSYDTHVPLIFFGGEIPQGQTDRKVNIRDIAPTISTILGISHPNGCTGNPLPEVTQ
tara:strand:+ start:10508 stop:12091 length:1584 start_codon:yes stop_codon:yes gene_type:complete